MTTGVQNREKEGIMRVIEDYLTQHSMGAQQLTQLLGINYVGTVQAWLSRKYFPSVKYRMTFADKTGIPRSQLLLDNERLREPEFPREVSWEKALHERVRRRAQLDLIFPIHSYMRNKS